MKRTGMLLFLIASLSLALSGCTNNPKDLERPEHIVSLRQVMYDSATYAKLARMWKDYYEVYPSEEAYGNWMYASKYAELPDYESLVTRGVDKYPSSPVLLYLLGNYKSSRQNNLEGMQFLEKSAALDPRYMDPWYALVVAYMSQGDREKTDVALRRLLEGGAVQEVVMDFCYNMIAGLDSNAILITNGDNDTFPNWILTRIVRFRPDVNIVNRSLLNVDWYTREIVKDGVPPFITSAGIDSLNKAIAREFEQLKGSAIPHEQPPLYGDRLVGRIIATGQRTGRPVYFACTVERNQFLKAIESRGRALGLVTLVTSTTKPYDVQARGVLKTWLCDFRTGGLDSWQLRNAKDTDAGRSLARNYADALRSLQDPINSADEKTRLSLFQWYRDRVLAVLPQKLAEETNIMWCSSSAPREIKDWCKAQGIAQ
jgi:tetratricopeptide (TPR) repeat protein